MATTEVVNTNLRWEIEEARCLIESVFGNEQREFFNRYTKPFIHRQYHAQYHFQEIQRLLNVEIDEKLVEKHIVEILFVEFTNFQPTLVKIEAHMIACAQSIHSITDIFAHAVYYALGLNLTEKPLKDKDVNFKNVINKITDERFLKARNSMSELLNSNLYKALENIVIQGKHRGLKEPVISVSFEENKKPYSLKFPSFVFDEKQQSEREFEEFLSPIYAMTSQMTVRSGILINEVLSSKD